MFVCISLPLDTNVIREAFDRTVYDVLSLGCCAAEGVFTSFLDFHGDIFKCTVCSDANILENTGAKTNLKIMVFVVLWPQRRQEKACIDY